MRWRCSSRSLAEHPALILASRSPQRRAILEQLGVTFEVFASDVDELESGDPAHATVENALRKASAVAGQRPDELVLGADTVVYLDGVVYGKPSGVEEARQMLRTLSGRRHTVVGGLCLARGDDRRTAVAATAVRFRELPGELIEWYLESGEWAQRAGSYAIQGRGAALVAEIDGDYLNVVGLPVATLLEFEPGLVS